MAQAKRVVLRLREADMNDRDIYEPARLYFEKHGHSSSEIESNRHFIHIQPPNPHIPQADPKLHVIIDMEVKQHSGHLSHDFPHEFFLVRREGTELCEKHLIDTLRNISLTSLYRLIFRYRQN